MSKLIIGFAALVALSIATLALVLGPDFRPFVRALRSDAKSEIESQVDPHRLHLARAEHALAEARHRAEEMKHALAATEAAVVRLGGELRAARRESEDAGYGLRKLKEQVEAGQEVRTADGRVLTKDEVELLLRDHEHRVQLAGQKVIVLEDVIRRHRARQAALEPVVRDAPAELKRLELSVKHLREKVKLYEELKDLKPDTVSTGGDPFAEARRELEAAHADVDLTLRVLEGRLTAGGERGPAAGAGE
jgi:chromosome segregation ATPase